MTVSADHLRRLAALGLPSEVMGEVLSILAEVEEGTGAQSPGAIRTRRWREKQNVTGDVTVTSPNVTTVTPRPSQNVTHAGASAEPKITNSSSTLSKNKEEEKQQERADARVTVLAKVLDAERAQAVVDHRQRMGKRLWLTEHSAGLLAKKFARCPDPNVAADAMISNGWQGFEPDWLENRATGPPGRPFNGHGAPTMTDILNASRDVIAEEENRSNVPTTEFKALSH